MLLSPHEQERLLLHVAAGLAQQRRDRGLKLNYPEAVALISAWVLEGARDGRSVAELMTAGQQRADPRRRAWTACRRWSLRAGRGHVPGRHQARHRAPADRMIAGRVPAGRRAGRDRPAAHVELRRGQLRGPAGAGRLALPLRRGQPGAAVRPGGRDREAAGGARRHGGAVRAGRRAHRAAGRAGRHRRPCRGCGSRELVDGSRGSSTGPATPSCTARPPATGCGWPTPTCSSRSPRTAAAARRAATRWSSAAAR